MAENIQRALKMATINVQLGILPTFSNEPTANNSSASEWL
jgi:hypothetical protein